LTIDGRTLGSIAYLAPAGSVAGFSLLYWLLAAITAASASLLNLVLPILALAEGWAVYGERLNFSLALGPAAQSGQQRALAGTDTSPQRHETGQFESNSDPDARPAGILTV
jgi:hypothetical protein